MLTHSRPKLAYSLPFPQQVDPPAGPPAGDPPLKIEFTAEQQAKVNAIEAAARKDAEERTAARLAAEATAKAEKEEAERKRKADEDRGAFDQVKSSLEQERDSVAGERDTYKGKVEFFTKHFEADFAQRAKAVDKSFELFKPADTAPLEDRLDWLTKAEQGTAKLPSINRGNGPDPKGSDGRFDMDGETAKARQTGKYTA